MLDCTICFSNTKEFYILPDCGHSFCLNCINQMKDSNGTVICPNCKKACLNASMRLVKNYILNSLIDNPNSNTQSNDNNIKEIIWFDLHVNNMENKIFQDCISDSAKHVHLVAFDDLEEFKNYMNSINKRTLLIVSGSLHKKAFEICYEKSEIEKIIVFTFKVNNYAEIKPIYSKIYQVVDSIESLLKCISELI